MDSIKKVIGFVLIIGGAALGCLIVYIGIFHVADVSGYTVAIAMIIVFSPIAVGLSIFGYYAFRGEYNKPIS